MAQRAGLHPHFGRGRPRPRPEAHGRGGGARATRRHRVPRATSTGRGGTSRSAPTRAAARSSTTGRRTTPAGGARCRRAATARRSGRGASGSGPMTTRELRLVGAGGEPVDLVRTLNSHGFVDLPPMRPDPDYRARRAHPADAARAARDGSGSSPGGRGHARVTVLGPRASDAAADELAADGPPRPAARRRPLGLLRGGVRRPGPRVGDERGRAAWCRARPCSRTS